MYVVFLFMFDDSLILKKCISIACSRTNQTKDSQQNTTDAKNIGLLQKKLERDAAKKVLTFVIWFVVICSGRELKIFWEPFLY